MTGATSARERRPRRAGRDRDRRWRPGRGGPGRPTRRSGSRGRRPGTVARLVLARRGRLHVAGGGRRAAASRPGRRHARRRRATDPRDARRDPLRDDIPPHLRRRDGGEPAVGFDRSRLDPALLDLAADAGADVRRGWHVTDVRPADRPARRRATPTADQTTIRASVVVGADGLHSVVARGAGVARPARLDPRVGLTYHLPDPDPDACRDARMRVLRDGYVGIAPVAGGRVNVGIVLGRSWRSALRERGARAVADCDRGRHPSDGRRPGRLARRLADRCRGGCLATRPSGHTSGRAGLAARRRCGRVPRPVHRRGPAPRPRLGGAGGGRDRRA